MFKAIAQHTSFLKFPSGQPQAGSCLAFELLPRASTYLSCQLIL